MNRYNRFNMRTPPVCRLLAKHRFHDMSHRNRIILWQPIASYDPSTFASLVTLIPQKSELFSGTLKENLHVADASANGDALWSVLINCAVQGVCQTDKWKKHWKIQSQWMNLWSPSHIHNVLLFRKPKAHLHAWHSGFSAIFDFDCDDSFDCAYFICLSLCDDTFIQRLSRKTGWFYAFTGTEFCITNRINMATATWSWLTSFDIRLISVASPKRSKSS